MIFFREVFMWQYGRLDLIGFKLNPITNLLLIIKKIILSYVELI